jgi:hypothetical protein
MSRGADPTSQEGDDRRNIPQIVPYRQKIQIGSWLVPVVAIRTGAVFVVLGVAEWLFQNFLQLRGVVDLLASRIDLVFLWLACLAAVWILTAGIKRKTTIRSMIAIALIVHMGS